MIIVTGASQNHAKSVIQLIHSFLNYYSNNNTVILIVYDLGFNSGTRRDIENLFSSSDNVVFKSFDYSLCPSFFNINICSGEYAWKPVLFYNEYCKYISGRDGSVYDCLYGSHFDHVLIWMDAGNIILGPLTLLENTVKQVGIYSEYSAGNIIDWTHPTTIASFGIEKYVNEINKNTACFGVYRNWSRYIIDNFVRDFCFGAYRREMIAPFGSSRANHRQDQTLFTCLFYIYKEKYGINHVSHFDHINMTYGLMNYAIHRDCEF
jgi:hypothetical protein